jgi:hypothetical protein
VSKKIRANPCASVVKFSLFFPQKYVIILTLYSGSAGVNVCLPAPGGKNASDKPPVLNLGYLDFEIVSDFEFSASDLSPFFVCLERKIQSKKS